MRLASVNGAVRAGTGVRTPPPVSVVIGPDAAWWAFQGLVLALESSVTAAWALTTSELPSLERWGSALAVLAASLPAVVVFLRREGARGPQRLVFDGQSWSLVSPSQAGEPVACRPVVAADLGGWMLLRIDPAPSPAASAWSRSVAALLRRRWIALTRSSVAAHWHALRVALYCFQPEQTGRPLEGRPRT